MPEGATPRPDAGDADWAGLTPEAAYARLDSAPRGLSEAAAQARLREAGPNTIEARSSSGWGPRILRQVNSPLILILIAGAALSAALGDWGDAATIAAIVVLNGVLGVSQEWRAERAVAALRAMLAPTARVMRGGHVVEVPAESIVPGDLLLIERGDRVAADLVIVDAADLAVDESVLTGESLPVDKFALGSDGDGADASLAFAGTLVARGRGRALVVATGANTRFGGIAALTGAIDRAPTTLQVALARIARLLGIGALAIGLFVVGLGYATGRPLTELLFTAVALAIAIVPEGLPAVVTLTLGMGMFAMARRGALLRRMQAAETLGAATLICTDKTGTLTQNEMTAVRAWLPGAAFDVAGAGYVPEGDITPRGDTSGVDAAAALGPLARCAVQCNNATLEHLDGEWCADGAPTELALLVLGEKAGVHPEPAARRRELPFDSTRKRMAVVVDENGAGRVYVKGAPEVVIERCNRLRRADGETAALTDALRGEVDAALEAIAGDGLRVLALAGRALDDPGAEPDALERDLELYGLVGIVDPPRDTVPAAVASTGDAGIGVIMVTGDAGATAESIAASIGMRKGQRLSGAMIDTMDDAALDSALVDGAILARVTPEHKLRVVRLLQARGEIVAMTGDGVNDAPALKQANVGVAMGRRGTDVAREAADIVLTDDNFSAIVNAIAEGRRQFNNIRHFVTYLLSSNFGEVVALIGNLLVGGPLILLPVQILWMNLVTDGVTAVALGAEPGRKALMDDPPRPVDEPLLRRRHLALVAALGGYIGIVTLGVFAWCLAVGRDMAHAQTLAFTTIIVLEKFNVLNFRSLRAPLHRIGWFSNPWVMSSWAGMLALQVLVVYVPFFNEALHTVPLPASDWLIVLAFALPTFLVPEGIKIWRGRG